MLKRRLPALIFAIVLTHTYIGISETLLAIALSSTVAGKVISYYTNNGILVTSKDRVTEHKANETHGDYLSFKYAPTDGISFSLNYANMEAISSVLVVNANSNYASAKASEAMLGFIMGVCGFSESDAGDILLYLLQTTRSDPVWGSISELVQGDFKLKYINPGTNSLFISIYPADGLL